MSASSDQLTCQYKTTKLIEFNLCRHIKASQLISHRGIEIHLSVLYTI